jgi:hypothetical protein
LKKKAQLEAIARYEDKKKEIFDSLHRQFSEMIRASGDEIEKYVKTLSPAKQTNVAILRDPHLRKRSQKPSCGVNSSPTENFRSIFSTISKAIGNDLQAVVI